MHPLLNSLVSDFPELTFAPSRTFFWSPKDRIIHYQSDTKNNLVSNWSLLHELSHALLDHQTYMSDFELLQMELDAWLKAEKLAQHYGYEIDQDHIQDCIDTYRDWLYQRSTCPTCTSCSTETSHRTYTCLNCGTEWKVSASRLCRPYRRKQKEVQAKA